MYNHLIGKKYLFDKGERIIAGEVQAIMESEYFSDEGYKDYEDDPGNPGALINNVSPFLVFFCVDIETRETFRVNEFETLMDISGLYLQNIRELIIHHQQKKDENISNKNLENELFFDIGLDKHYLKCKEFGMNELESLNAVKDLINEKIKKQKNGK